MSASYNAVVPRVIDESDSGEEDGNASIINEQQGEVEISTMTKEESIDADESRASNDFALILLVVLILCAAIAIISIVVYNRNRGHSCCKKKTTKVADEKSTDDKLKDELRGKRKVNLKPLWDVKQDENGKTKIDMIAGHFETVSYLVPRGGGFSSRREKISTNTNSHKTFELPSVVNVEQVGTDEATPTPDVMTEPRVVEQEENKFKLPNPADRKRRFTIEAEMILGADIETAAAIAEHNKLAPSNVINEESSS